MVQISSNATLLLKTFLPMLWFGFMGAFTLVVFFQPGGEVTGLPMPIFQAVALLSFIGGGFLIYRTFMQLKRVEIGPKELYITNYYKHARYPLTAVESVRFSRFGLFKLGHISLREPGIFGKEIYFISSRRWQIVLDEIGPELIDAGMRIDHYVA